MKKVFISLFILTFLVTSCKSKKVINNTKNTNMLLKEVVKNYKKNSFTKKTISASIKAKYKGKENLPSVNVSLRIKKDQVIWMSISKFISIGKLKITPNRVQFYNKISKEYFDGDFSLLSNFLGTEVTFEQVQNILVGQAVYPLNIKDYTITPQDDVFLFEPKEQKELFQIIFMLYATNFKIAKQEVTQQKKYLEVNYPSYQKIDNQFFPKEIFIKSEDGNVTNSVSVLYKSVTFNKKLSFPFKIPSGYKQIKL